MKNNQLTNTLKQIAQLSKGMEVDLDQNGNLRSLTTNNTGGLQNSCSLASAWLSPNKVQQKSNNSFDEQPVDGVDAFYIANEFINQPIIKEHLQSANIELDLTDITPFAFGYRISFRQISAYPQKNMLLPVYGGSMHMAMNKLGEIFSLTSTLQYEKANSKQEALISETEAIKLASASCQYKTASAAARLVLLAHNGMLEPAYEVKVVCVHPSKNYICLVLANTGIVIDQRPRTLYYHRSKISDLVKARALLKTPDPNKPIPQQISKAVIERLPNPQVLRDRYLNMLTGKTKDVVYAKPDGTYCYQSNYVEFAAVSVFISLVKQLALYLQSGMVEPGKQQLTVVVNDSSVKDNAYFDPQHYEIHLGVGTGVDRGGLTKHIAYDLGVANHEFGHVIAYWQTVAGDLAGRQGIALNEAVGDVLGTLVMDYLARIWYADQFGQQLTKVDLQKDARVIGTYALPPFGIRTQKNGRTTPNDLTGEPHGDGLIVGGALADLLIAMATEPDKSIEDQIKLFVKLSLMAMALLPGYKVMFSDMLRAMITADQQISDGQYRPMIEKFFHRHGIVLNAE